MGKVDPVINGVDTTAMTREQLEEFTRKLENEMNREREERNFFQLERDKIRTFWEISRNQLEEARAQIRNKEREVEIAQETAEDEIKLVMQRMKHLQYDNQTKLNDMRADLKAQLQKEHEIHLQNEKNLLAEKSRLKQLLREKTEASEAELHETQRSHNQILNNERDRCRQEAQNIVNLYQGRMDMYREESALRHQMEINQIEESKNTQLAGVIKHHDNSFTDLRNYYNDITQNNLSLISSMKEQIEEMNKTGELNKKIVFDITTENKKLVEPLKQAQMKAYELKKCVLNYERDKLNLSRLTVVCDNLQDKITGINKECDNLITQCAELSKENTETRKQFKKAVLELQQTAGQQNAMLESRIGQIEEDSEKRNGILANVINLTGIDENKFRAKIEEIVTAKNEKINNLRFELARVTKAHDDLLRTMEVKMRDFGVPIKDLQFRPFKTIQNIRLGTGPAGLVSKKKK